MEKSMSNKTESKETAHFVDEQLETMLKVAENIRKMAETEAHEIIEDAKKRAYAVEKEPGLNEAAKTGAVKTDIKERDRELSGICSKEVFRIILERERSRTDRNGHELSLIIFDLSEEKNDKPLHVLINAFKTRARSVDRFGWYMDGHIGIILPNTTYKGGLKFAHSICEKIIAQKSTPLDFKVYSHPTNWLPIKSRYIREKHREIRKKHPEHVEGVDPLFVMKIPVWKRTLDILGALLALILASPFFVIIPIIIKIGAPGPVFFKQERVGYGGRIFTFFKFRTMKIKTDSTAHQNYLSELIKSEKPMTKLDKSNDPRIIPFGRFLRKSCIDELPQLIHVLKGEMSLVGPRPCLPYEAKEYLKWHKYRFDIKPGMTGLWQVSGKNRLTFKEMIRLDIMYAKRLSLGMDLWLLFATVPAVISMIIDKFTIDAFFNKVEKKHIPEEQFKDFIKKYYSDIYNVDKLEFLDDKLKSYNVDLTELVLLLSKLNRLSPTYNVAKRYFGICRLIDFEKKSQSRNINTPIHS